MVLFLVVLKKVMNDILTTIACDAWSRTNNLLNYVEKEIKDTARLTCRLLAKLDAEQLDIFKMYVFDNYLGTLSDNYMAQLGYDDFMVEPYYISDDQWGVTITINNAIEEDLPTRVLFDFTECLKDF